MTSSLDFNKLKELYTAAGQGQVFRFEEKLNEEEKIAFYEQLQTIDVEGLAKKYAAATNPSGVGQNSARIEPVQASVKIAEAKPEERARWEELGYRKIAEGKVATLVVAGGQGTRLGCPDPKGTVDIGLLSHRSLFQIQAERLIKLQQLVTDRLGKPCKPIRWYVMTSIDTDDKTQNFFKDHNYFGLNAQDVVFFQQGLLPCLTKDGHIMLESAGRVAMAPDGNGGLYHALDKWGILQDMRKNEVEYMFQYCVDNILIKMVDPVFLGFLYESAADVGCKVAPKSAPNEAVGVLALRDGKYGVIEYSEIDKELAAKRDEKTGELMFNAGHLCMNTYRIDFLEKAAREYSSSLPYHLAFKKIHCADEEGNPVIATANNGYKLEQFIFDVFEHANKLVAFEIVREEEFSPLKNASGAGKDCPETCRRDLYNLHKRYITRAGGRFLERATNGSAAATNSSGGDEPLDEVEISPLVSYAGEGLEGVKGQTYGLPFFMDAAVRDGGGGQGLSVHHFN